MRNNMENLVGRKVRCLTSRWDDLTLNKVYDINKETYFNFYITNDDLFQDEFSKHHLDNSSFELLVDEPKFKQGDKVLVSYNEIDWHETEFVCYYKDYYYTINGRAKNIKPYEEEIKVGDWVKNTDEKELILVTKDMNLKCLNNESEYIKITNQQLIELLNNEL